MAYHNPRREERREINVEQVIGYLSSAFNNATRSMGFKNQFGTKLYELQCNMAWLQHEIATGPRYIVPKHIQTATDLIANVENSN